MRNFITGGRCFLINCDQIWSVLIKGWKVGRFNLMYDYNPSICLLCLLNVWFKFGSTVLFLNESSLNLSIRELGSVSTRLGSICTCCDLVVCLKPSTNCSVSQVYWPILSNNMLASVQHVAFAVNDAPVSHVSTGRTVKRVSRQRNLSTHDTPSVVWPYSADGFDRGQTAMKGSIFCLRSGFVSSL